jgi:hypothetical protein
MKSIFQVLTFCFLIFSSLSHSQWTEQTIPGDILITLGIDFNDQNHGVMGGWHFNFGGNVFGNSFYTTDTGTNWIETNIPDSMRVLIGVKLFNDNLGYGVGAYNLSTPKSSQNNPGQTKNFSSVHRKYFENLGMNFNSQQDYRGFFVETTDGGLNWHPKGSFEDSVYYLIGMHFLDMQTGFILATGPSNNTFAAILKTTDGGNSWEYVYNFDPDIFLNDIKFYDQLNGIAVGAYDDMVNFNGVVLRTTDGGNTWGKIMLPFIAAIDKVAYLDINTIIIGGSDLVFQGVVYKSTNGGISWQEFKNYGNMANVNVVSSLPTSGTVLICGVLDQSGLTMPYTDISIDGGLTWHYAQLSGFQGYAPFNAELFDYSRWYLTGTKNSITEGFVLFTDNSGGVPVELISFTSEFVNAKVNLNWTTATELNNLGFEVERKSERERWRTIGFVEGKGTTTETQNYNFIDDLFGVADSKIYYRLKQIDFNGTHEYSKEIEIEIAPVTFSLEQNYPNPFNPSTKIKYTIPETGNPLLGGARGGSVTLKVFDILGNEVATLLNEEQEPGVYEVEFNANGLPSGIYFYKLTAGEYNQTQKMIYLK